MKWNIAYLGTYHPAVPTLERLAERGWVCIVIMPEEAGTKNDGLREVIDRFSLPWSYCIDDVTRHPVNLVLAANYPKLVPARILSKCPCINTHWSALPKFRGVHGTAWALLNGDNGAACTVHLMGSEFDVGEILAQEFVKMTPEMEDIEDLHRALAVQQVEMVLRVLESYSETTGWRGVPQDESKATYVPQRVPEDGCIDWEWPTERVWNLVRALPSPKYPGAFTYLRDRKLIVWKARPVSCPVYFSTCGQVVRVRKGTGVWVKTGDTCIELQDVEFEGAPEGRQPADRVLRRGDKLGYDPQREIAVLKTELAELRRDLTALRQKTP